MLSQEVHLSLIHISNDPKYAVKQTGEVPKVSGGEGLVAAMPFILIFVLLLLTSKLFPAINGPLASIKTSVPIYQGAGAKPYTFVWIATPGIMIFIAGIVGGFIQKAKAGEIFGTLGSTVKNLKFTYLTCLLYTSITDTVNKFLWTNR